jgi:hypothetical protein
MRMGDELPRTKTVGASRTVKVIAMLAATLLKSKYSDSVFPA